MTDWQKIVGRHSRTVWQTAYRLLGDREEAADCFQETFLAALELSRREKVRNFSALLKRLCTFRAMDRLRKRVRLAGRENTSADFSSIAGSNPGPVQQAQAAELSERLRMALADLPEKQAEVFCLRCVDQMSYREIAGQLGVKRSSVGVMLHRARSRLRELLSQQRSPLNGEV